MFINLLDWTKRQKPGGGIDDIVEVLAASNPIIADAHVEEGNLPTGHRSTQRATEPTGTWRMLNQGIAPEKSTTRQVDDTCGMLEGLSQIDVDLAGLGGKPAAFRASEDDAFIAGLNGTAARAIFYGNSNIDPQQPHGFTPRSNAIGPYVLSAGGTGTDNASVWVITWGSPIAFLTFPKGSKAGISSTDMGIQLVSDIAAPANRYRAYVTHFQWKLGLVIRDFRYVVRICNIDKSDLRRDAATGADLLDLMITAYYRRPSVSLGKMAKTFVYCPKIIAEFLHKQAMNKANVNLRLGEADGQPVVSFLGAPIHICDALDPDEARVI